MELIEPIDQELPPLVNLLEDGAVYQGGLLS